MDSRPLGLAKRMGVGSGSLDAPAASWRRLAPWTLEQSRQRLGLDFRALVGLIQSNPRSITTVGLRDVVAHLHILKVHALQGRVPQTHDAAHEMIDKVRVIGHQFFEVLAFE